MTLETNSKNLADPLFSEIWKQCQHCTMTSYERGLTLFNAIRHIALNGVVGDIVECGVWRGGSAMIAIKAMQHFNIEREIWLFDTFEGMTAPSQFDVDHEGKLADKQLQDASEEKDSALIWARATLEEVKNNINRTGYPERLVHYVKGKKERSVY